jgi:NAD(P)-dependent dehydrogenase (short-subunit alcohol dehydrogenase family)
MRFSELGGQQSKSRRGLNSPIRHGQDSRPVCVVTGGSAGVGRATALHFAVRGWNVAVLARGRPGVDSTCREIEHAGSTSLPFTVDVADSSAVFAAADAVIHAWGRIDVWVNNAMATVFGKVDDLTPAEFRRVTEVTYLGQVHGTLAALRHMKRRNRGTIVQVGSALSYRSIPLQSAYCGAKAAVRGFTDSLRSELIHEKSSVRLTMVQLPAVNTPQFDWARNHLGQRLQPVPPIYQPETIAAAIFGAARTAPREMWIGKSTLEALVGTMIAPALLDRMMASRAWDGQMTPEAALNQREGNLFAPVTTDPGAHGRLDTRSHPTALAFPSQQVRGALFCLGLVAAMAGVTAARATGGSRH